MTILKKIKNLRKAWEDDRLVIFVGAGVSCNSGIPSWYDLIKIFAIKLGIDKCDKCKLLSNDCPDNCKEKYNFCRDDYLKIPQYFFNKSEPDYWKTIQKVFNVKAKPNEINNMIMELQPKHIITTNFDKLIENTDSLNKMIYRIVVKNEDLLNNKSKKSYIIKMHGDIDEPSTIVLKEDDYLNYSRNHILIETFIKSLLVDHTFLFIGYALNDYNLKLIINWLEYLAKDCKEGERKKNYIFTDSKGEHNDNYYSKKNIITINVSEIPNLIKDRYSDIMLKEAGRNIYALLKCILEADSDYHLAPLLDILFERYQIFKDRKRVSYEELKHYHTIGPLELTGSGIKLYDKSNFISIKKILEDKSEKAKFVKKILLKTGIKKIHYESSSIEVEVSNYVDSYIELLKLDQKNRYKDVLSKSEKIGDEISKSYYLHLLIPSQEKLPESMEKIEKELLNSDDYFKLLVFKFNRYCLSKLSKWKSDEFREVDKVLKNIPERKRRSYSYFEKIFEGNYDDIIMCKELAEKCINTYTDINTTYYGIKENMELLKLQAISYNYYYYFKINNLMVDRFTNPKKILEPYVRSMLCTYFPQEEKTSAFFGIKSNPPERYFLNSTDLDIIVKYTNLDKLKSFFRDYRVEGIRFEKEVKIEKRLKNLCKSVIKFPDGILASYLNTFLLLLPNCSTKDFNVNVVAESISELLSDNFLLDKNILLRTFEGVRAYFEAYIGIIKKVPLTKVLKGIVNRETIDYCINHHLDIRGFFKLILGHIENEISEKIGQLIRERDGVKGKMETIYLLYPLFNEKQKNIYSTYLKNNIKSIPIWHLYDYIIKGYLEYSKDIEKRYLQIIKEEVRKRKEKPGQREFPDPLLRTIDELIILFLAGKIGSLKKFKSYLGYSEHLSFLLDPKSYDFSKLQSLDYMWGNFLRYEKYRKIILNKGTELKKNLDKAVQNGRATKYQKAILYGFFLTMEEKYKYM